METDKNSTQLRFASTLHACAYCGASEFDADGMERYANIEKTVVKYRGHKVIDGASRGCVLFKDCLRRLHAILQNHGQPEGAKSAGFRAQNWVYSITASRDLGHYHDLEIARGRWSCSEGELSNGDRHPDTKATLYTLLAVPGTSSDICVETQQFVHDFKSPKSIAWAKQRLSECENHHHGCGEPIPRFRPTHMLKIVGSGSGKYLRIQLHETSTNRDEYLTENYATLSYCWGDQQTTQLNAGTKEQLEHGIMASSLPKTLYDAVRVTHNLGLHWLWIDSLCIPQDDANAKALEIARMHMVYEHSYITISAARASDCRQGFLEPCSLPFPGSPGVTLPFVAPSGEMGSIILARGHALRPIDLRSWTLQEHLLARRVLRYTDCRLHWSCNSVSQFEGPPNDPESNDHGLPGLHTNMLTEAHDFRRSLKGSDRSCQLWMDIVSNYTKRLLTNPADRLPALSGIAEAWNSTSQDKYLAGVWASHLPLGLMWFSMTSSRLSSSVSPIPSWSWASVDGEIAWDTDTRISIDHDLHFDLTLCVVNPIYKGAPYGLVASGQMELRGRLRRANILTHLQATGLSLDFLARCSSSSTIGLTTIRRNHDALNLSEAEVFLDATGKELAGFVKKTSFHALQISTYDSFNRQGPSGLILATDDEKNFRRIGIFDFPPPTIDDNDYGAMQGDLNKVLDDIRSREHTQKTAFDNCTTSSLILH